MHDDPHIPVLSPDSFEDFFKIDPSRIGKYTADYVRLNVGEEYVVDQLSDIPDTIWQMVHTDADPPPLFKLFWYVAQKTQYFASDNLEGVASAGNATFKQPAALGGSEIVFPVSLWARENVDISLPQAEPPSYFPNETLQKMADALIPHTIRAVAGLYRLFWDEVCRVAPFEWAENWTLMGEDVTGVEHYGATYSIEIGPAYTVTSAGYLHVSAGEKIILHPGFRVEKGGRFNASINRPQSSFAFGSFGTGPGQFNEPSGVATDSADRIIVLDTYRIQVFDATGTLQFAFGDPGPEPGQFFGPLSDVATDSTNRIILADMSFISIFNTNGTFQFRVDGISPPFFIATDSADRIIIATSSSNIQVFDAAGTFQFAFGSFGTGPGQFNEPSGVATDSADRIIVADSGNHRIQVFE